MSRATKTADTIAREVLRIETLEKGVDNMKEVAG